MSGLRSVMCLGVAIVVGCQAIAGVGDKSFGSDRPLSHHDASVDGGEPPDVSVGGASGSGGAAAGGSVGRMRGADAESGTGGLVRGVGGSGGTGNGGGG